MLYFFSEDDNLRTQYPKDSPVILKGKTIRFNMLYQDVEGRPTSKHMLQLFAQIPNHSFPTTSTPTPPQPHTIRFHLETLPHGRYDRAVDDSETNFRGIGGSGSRFSADKLPGGLCRGGVDENSGFIAGR